MNRFKSLLIVAAFGALVGAPVAAQKNVAAQSMLEAAKQKETLEGDLAGAIRQYQAIVERYSKTDRGVAAQALVHMAGCYLKLGNAEAQKIYARIVKDFADQPEAVTVARAHLAGSNTDTRQTTTRVWSGPKVFAEGTISPDGRYLSGTDWDTGDLQIHDLITGADRRLTNKGTWAQSSDFAVGSAISRDGKQGRTRGTARRQADTSFGW